MLANISINTAKQQVLRTLILHNGEVLLPEEIKTETSRFSGVDIPLSTIEKALQVLNSEGEITLQEEFDGIYYGS